jgi:hypothetical protein
LPCRRRPARTTRKRRKRRSRRREDAAEELPEDRREELPEEVEADAASPLTMRTKTMTLTLTRFKTLALLLTIAFVAVVGLQGCTFGPDKSREDAVDITTECEQTDSTGCVDKRAPKSITFNNHFPNVETKCDGFGNRIYATTDEHGNGVIIRPDPSCPGYVAAGQPPAVLGIK